MLKPGGGVLEGRKGDFRGKGIFSVNKNSELAKAFKQAELESIM